MNRHIRVLRSRMEPKKDVARSPRSHREQLLNGFRARGQLSAGSLEGFNNKAKLTMRESYDFRTLEALGVDLYHNHANLPEPKQTDSFW